MPYRTLTEIPSLVQLAMALSDRLQFDRSCSREFGRLLHALAAHCPDGRIAEIGTGCGVGAAWIVSALAPTASFVTVDANRHRAAVARKLFQDYPSVRVLEGDWRILAREAPFNLLFADTGDSKRRPDEVLGLMEPGGLVVMDDMTPEEDWPPEWRGQVDAVREAWLNRRDVAVTEIVLSLTTREAALFAVRRA